MAKHKEVKKSNKEVKKPVAKSAEAKETKFSAIECSDVTRSILSVAKKAGADKVTVLPNAESPRKIRVYVGETPLLLITGASTDTPSVCFKVRLRAEPKERAKAFRALTGLSEKEAKFFRPDGSCFTYSGKHAVARVKSILPRMLKADAS